MKNVIVPMKVINSELLGFPVNPKEMIKLKFTVGFSLDGVDRLSNKGVINAIEEHKSFRELFNYIGFDLDIEPLSVHGHINQEFKLELERNKSIITIEEINPIDLLDANSKISKNIVHDNNKFVFYQSILSNSIETVDYIKNIRKKLSLLSVHSTRGIRRRTVNFFDIHRYTKADINDNLVNIYKFFTINDTITSSTDLDRVLLNSNGLFKIKFETLSEYKNITPGDINYELNGYVYHTSKMENMYMVVGSMVTSLQLKYDNELDGSVILYENGNKIEILSGDDLKTIGFYKDKIIADTVSSEHSNGNIFNKEMIRIKKELEDTIKINEALNSKIKDYELLDYKNKNNHIKRDITNSELILKNVELKRKHKDGGILSHIGDDIDNIKKIALGTVAIIGAGYAIKSYFSE